MSAGPPMDDSSGVGAALPEAPAASGGAPAPGTFKWPEERGGGATPGARPAARASRLDWLAQRLTLFAGVGGALWIFFAPLPAGLTPAAKTAFAVFLLCTALWMTNVIPFGVTGLLAVALLSVTGAMKASDAFAAFGNPAVFFLIGVFIIGGALVESGLSKRCALLFLRRFERSPYAFAYGMTLAAAFGTLWMPNQATSAMLFPIALEVALALRLHPMESPYAKVLFLSLAWGAMVGSNASFLGSTRAALALGMLQENFGRSISFMQWVVAAAPVVILGVAVAPLVLRLAFRQERVDFASARTLLDDAVQRMGPMRRRQWTVTLIVGLTVAAWITLSGRVDLAVIALLGAAALFATGAITWEQAERRVFWNIVLMYGGAIALGAVIDDTGAARWLVDRVLGDYQLSPYLVIAATLIGTLLLSEFMSNVAAVAVMLPLAFSVGQQVGGGVSPVALVLATSIGAGLDFALPFSSAPNTIVFASGYLRMIDVVKAGALMTVVSVIIVLLVAALWWPLIGIL
ncbi:MAG: SLC13 family permease [Gemmatimonadaceae bacterium]